MVSILSDHAIIDAIVRAIAPCPARRWWNCPGLVALTQPLVERLGQLTVIELDRDLAARLRSHGQLKVVESDVLKVDFTHLGQALGAPKMRVVGNLPYNISTPILFHLLQYVDGARPAFHAAKEVIDRMVANSLPRPITALVRGAAVALRHGKNVLFVCHRKAFDPPHGWTARWYARKAVGPACTGRCSTAANCGAGGFSQRRKLLRRHSLGVGCKNIATAVALICNVVPKRCPWLIT